MSIAVLKYHNSAFDGNSSLTLDHIKDVPIWVAWQQTVDGRKLPISAS